MIVVILTWICILLVFPVIGFSIAKAVGRFSREKENTVVTLDQLFFLGFLSLSAFTGILSIFIPIGYPLLIFILLLTVLLLMVNLRDIKAFLLDSARSISVLTRPDKILLSFIMFFILASVVQRITLGDSESYHVQTIQWIRKYPVVPGLGNINGLLAFNSMFLTVSGLFAFQIRDVLIFPLNGLCYIVLIIKLFTLSRKEINQGTTWRAVFYILILLISLLVLLPDLNSPAPDIICAILVIYTFISIVSHAENEKQLNTVHIILFNLIIMSCIAYKLSSLFLVAALLFLMQRDFIKRGLITICIFVLVIGAFFVRNYYLSGYLVYPLPSVDIYNVDWKIPLENARADKLIIGAWARNWTLPYTEVAQMHINEWILPWFKLLSLTSKLLITVNFFSFFVFILMLKKKDLLLAGVQLVIIINLVFWFLMAPDPRFAYGFIFIGFSLTLSYIIKLIESSDFRGLNKYIMAGLAGLLILILGSRIRPPLDTLRKPSYWLIPASFGSVETKEYNSPFLYRVPVPEGGCFNAEIPCSPFPLRNVVLRGDDIQDGFKVIKEPR